MKFSATLLAFLGAISLVAAAPLDVFSSVLKPKGLAKRQYQQPGCRGTSWRCAMWDGALCLDYFAQECYEKCMKDRGCLVAPGPPDDDAMEKRDSQAHCGMRNYQCESQAEIADPGTNVTEIYHNCMEERGCEIPPSHKVVTTEHLPKRWHPHCGAWQSFKCTVHAERPSRWGDEDADVDEEYRACMIEKNCQCAIEYPYHCDKDNS